VEDTRPAYQLYVGVDIAAETFTAAWLPPGGQSGAPITGEQTAAGFAALDRRLRATAAPADATLVVLEATGSYWVALAVALHEAGYRVAVVNPRQAHHFAKAQLRRAKTDALDARDLARLAAALRPAPWAPPPAVYHEVRQRLVARDGLLAMRTQARNQRHALLQWPVVVAAVREHLDELIADLDRRIAALEAELAAALKDSAWAASLACLTSAPGIGLVTAAWLLVGTLNFALCDGPESLTAYAGLAPVPRESGRSLRGRAAIGHDGNGRLRTALYMATLSAARYNPAIRAFYQRLRAAGKPVKVARCAAARKLLHQAWALGSKLQRFDPDHKQQQHGAVPRLAA
jgi:transposase